MPDLEAFPKSHIVTFKYYVGVIFFLEEDYVQVAFLTPTHQHSIPTNSDKAEENLTEAYRRCYASSYRNKEYVSWLIPLITFNSVRNHLVLYDTFLSFSFSFSESTCQFARGRADFPQG